jgi:glucose/arabinose dehydrogenase
MKRLLLATLPCILLAGSPAGKEPATAPTLSHTVVLTKLDGPWDLAFLPDGTLFFTEKCLGLSVRLPSGTVVKLLGMKDSKGYASTANDLFCEGQAGMQGIAVDPDFARNRFIYVYATSSLTAPGTNRVLRLKVNDAVTAVSGRVDIVTDIPYKERRTTCPSGDLGRTTGGASVSAPAMATCT